jgi:hypothetical protein
MHKRSYKKSRRACERRLAQTMNSAIRAIRVVPVGTVALTVLFCGLVAQLSAADKIKINVRQSDATIRKQLLQLTPPGTSIAAVHDFLENRLYHEDSIMGWPVRRSGGAMIVSLGHYHEMRSFAQGLFLFPTDVGGYWYFDEHNKLRDIQVRRGVTAW